MNDNKFIEFRKIIKGRVLNRDIDKKEFEESINNRWNIDAIINKPTPLLIVYPLDENDIVQCILYCKLNDMDFAVKSGGHGFRSNCKNGLLLDLSGLKKIEVDKIKKIAIAQGGCTLGDFDQECQKYGLGVPSGQVSDTGLSGLTLGGGIGHLSRSYSLTSDSLLECTLVNCNGEIVIVNQKTDPDLFWALKSAGSNFGVVTSMTFKLHSFKHILLGAFVLFSNSQTDLNCLQEFFNFVNGGSVLIPNEMSISVTVSHGRVDILSILNGTQNEQHTSLVYKIKSLLNGDDKSVNVVDYAVLQKTFDQYLPRGKRYYKQGVFLNCKLDYTLIKGLLDSFSNHPFPNEIGSSNYTFTQLGGNVLNYESSFSFRNSTYHVGLISEFKNEQAKSDVYQWAKNSVDSNFNQYKIGFYSNTNDESFKNGEFFFGSNLDKLKSLKLKHDPLNFFKNNQNINSS